MILKCVNHKYFMENEFMMIRNLERDFQRRDINEATHKLDIFNKGLFETSTLYLI